jgi:site-specific DNA-methyltransferase (adenine-specific)
MLNSQLHHGDCISGMQGLQAGSIDLVFADPPFNIGYEYDAYDDRREAEQYLAWTARWGKEVVRVLKPTGTLWLAIGDEYAAELKLIFQKDLGLTCRSWVVWYYTFGVNCTKKFSRSHAHLFHFVKDPKNFTFNAGLIKVPSARQLVYADKRAVSGGRLPDDTWILRPQDLPEGFQPDEDTWYFRRVCGTFKERAGWHGCQMPEQLLGRIIRACSNPGEIVLDPFAGSGTTLVVAKKLGRRWLGYEISRAYFDQIQSRLDAAFEGQPLEGAEEPKASAPPTPQRRSEPNVPAPVLGTEERREPDEITRGIIEAFFAVRDGFSVDRVIADPDLNSRFIDVCRRLGIPGQPGNWNHRLMNLRKAGHLAGLPRSRKTTLSPEDLDGYRFACEIAIQELHQRGLALDKVLCEPNSAAELDRLVRSIAAKDLSSLRIRWIALRIRKRAREIAKSAVCTLDQRLSLPRKAEVASSLNLQAVPPAPGLYWLQSADAETKLYVGETRNLRQRFHLQFETSSFGFWGTERHNLEVRFRPSDEKQLRDYQSLWIAQWKPIGNYCKLAAKV